MRGSSPLTELRRGPVATLYSGQSGAVAVKVFPGRFDRRTLAAAERVRRRLATAPAGTPVLPVDSIDLLDDGRHALRMELCGGSLATLVAASGPLAVADVVALGRALSGALAVAHGLGIPHGGVNPNNVLFRAPRQPLLADFGVALRQAFPRDPVHLIEFVPPEALRTDSVDERTDLYGLGAVLHFALTGHPPHPGRLGEQPGERVLRVLGSPVPAINRDGVPVELSTVVARMLAADPAHRPPGVAAVAQQFAAMSSAPAEPVPAPMPVPAPPPVAVLPKSNPYRVAGEAPEESTTDSPSKIFPEPDVAPRGARPPSRRPLVAAAVGMVVLVAVVLVLVLRSGTDELATTPRPVPPVPSAPAVPGPAASARLDLAEPEDLGDRIVLNWSSDRPLDFAVVIAGDGESKPNRVLLAQRNHTMRVPVDPVRRYCFLVQGTDQEKVYESQYRSVRGAVCRE
ncbi:serine/threonine-protein kinase [Amycolatopsis minnesotensis]|uniref:non-specific serine/threonine protein kinase n=1 Tax=Amycolatopsis minnesotensis TaxID=337894 RepID=A0ABN2R3T1_9PSEU